MHKVLFWNPNYKVGGAERSLLDILKFIDRKRFYPVVVCSAQGQLLNAVRALGIQACVVSLPPDILRMSRKDKLFRLRTVINILRSIRPLLSMARLAIKEDIDVIYCNSLKADILGTAVSCLTGKKLIWHIRDILLQGEILRLFVFLGKSFPDKIITNSDFTSGQFSFSPPLLTKIKRIYNGVDTDIFLDR